MAVLVHKAVSIKMTTYKITVTYKIRRTLKVVAKSAAEAEGFVIDTINQNPSNEDVLISDYQSLVEEE